MRVALLVPGSEYTKNVARDLIYGCWCKGKRIAGLSFPPLTQVSIGTVLREDGHHVEILDAQSCKWSLPYVQEKIHSFDICILLTSTMTLNEDCKYLHALKKVSGSLLTMAYGGHVTAEPYSSLVGKDRKGAIDIVVLREPEYVIRDFIRSRFLQMGDWRKCKGIAYLQGERFCANELYPFIEDLDALPIPDRGLLPVDVTYYNPVVRRIPFTTMFTSRGCHGRCTFCASPYFYGRKERLRSSKKVIEEIEMCVDMGYREVFFRDESFTMSRPRVFEICEGIRQRKLDVTWVCSSRVNTVDLEMLKAMKNAGCHMIRFGVESGVQHLLDNVRKGIKTERTRQVFKWTRQIGIDTHAHLMIGLPGENQTSIQETLNFLLEIRPTTITVGILTPYPGTPLFEEVKKSHPEIGDGTESDLRHLHTKSFYNEYFTDLDPDKLAWAVRRIYRRYYLRPGYIWERFSSVRNVDQIVRLMVAGMNVFSFSMGDD